MELVVDDKNTFILSGSLPDVGLGLGDLVLVLPLELGELGATEGGLDGQPTKGKD